MKGKDYKCCFEYIDTMGAKYYTGSYFGFNMGRMK